MKHTELTQQNHFLLDVEKKHAVKTLRDRWNRVAEDLETMADSKALTVPEADRLRQISEQLAELKKDVNKRLTTPTLDDP